MTATQKKIEQQISFRNRHVRNLLRAEKTHAIKNGLLSRGAQFPRRPRDTYPQHYGEFQYNTELNEAHLLQKINDDFRIRCGIIITEVRNVHTHNCICYYRRGGELEQHMYKI